MDNQVTQNQTQEENAFAHLDFLFSQIPDHVYYWLFSEQAAINVTALAKRFSLNEIKTIQLARITGLVILKDLPLSTMALELKRFLKLDDTLIRQLSISTATVQFLPIRDHLINVEAFIQQMGGSLPSTLPPLLKSTSTIKYQSPIESISAPDTKIPPAQQKSLRQIVQENKEILNQILTTSPLNIADFDQPVRGTIKNWLADYVKQKGAERHDQMARGDYLFKSNNTKNLSSQEKLLIAEILKSYDENSTLNYDETNRIILLENSEKKSPETPRIPGPVLPSENLSSPYREPIEKKDLSSSAFSPPKAAPQIDGHVINLKDLQ